MSTRETTSETTCLRLPRGDDMHLHVRDGAVLGNYVYASALQFRRALIMPNTVPPTVTALMAIQYRERILKALEDECSLRGVPVPPFEPLMTLYLTNKTTPENIAEAKASGCVVACKLYPAGATTNSENGVTDVSLIWPTLAAMEEHGLVLCVHGEVTSSEVDIFDREAMYLEKVLKPIATAFPKLRIVLEHATTREAVEFVKSDESGRIAATITAHHLLHNRNDIFRGGLNPHYYCLPILKAEQHRQALVAAATEGKGRFFAGTDSAPHLKAKKECIHGCAGCFTAPIAVELYAEAFASVDKLDELSNFLGVYGAAFYGLPSTSATSTEGKDDSIQLEYVKENSGWIMPSTVEVAGDVIVPFRAGERVKWRASTTQQYLNFKTNP